MSKMTTNTPVPLSPASKTAQRTSMGHRFLGALRRGPYRKFSGSRPPSRLRNRGLALPVLALLAALTLGLLFMLPGSPLDAQEAMTELDYAENGTDPVATFTAVDPEGRTVYWSLPTTAPGNVDVLEGFDADDFTNSNAARFKISMDGVLNFKFPPDFESPMGEGTDGTGTSNTYSIVVASSDDAPGATTDGGVPETDNLPNMAYHKIEVTVTDVDEDGSVSLSGLQPQQGLVLTATLTDQDDADTDTEGVQLVGTKWKWEQSSAMDGPWTLISGATAAPYRPVNDVVGMYLRATATYTDKHGDDKTAMAVTAHVVRAVPAGQNAAPKFPDAENDNTADPQTREVKENSPPGTAVGKPVDAGDAGDVLTYTLRATTVGSGHADPFGIDRATGQIMTKGALDAEGPIASYLVTVRATDPYGDPNVGTADETNSDEVAVTITVDNVNEAPRFTVGPTRDEQEENEDTDEDTSNGIAIPTLSYAVTDADNVDADINWSLMGADKDAFEIDKDATPTPSGATSSATVMFKETPNYEMPTDANMDNMYMVTVVATDKKKLTATRDVVITVTNAADAGTITFSSVQPKVGIPFMATLTDEDGVVMESVKWQWYNDDPESIATPGTLDADASDDAIAKAKSDTYTPKSADLDPDGDGNVEDAINLHVWATYTDGEGSTSATAMAAYAVVVNQENQPPEFKPDGKVITATTRMVDEDTEALSTDDNTADEPGDNIGDAVTATDMSGTTDDRLTYTLGGRDAAMFRVRSDLGQIEVGADTDLDYETKKSYVVMVTATDPSLLSATIEVTINVIDVNEPPVIAGEDDLTKEFRENSTRTIETFRATDPEKRPVYWSLQADDGSEYPAEGSLTINSKSGALSFKNPPDFETPGADGANNMYTVRVVASDDAPNIGTDTTYREDAISSHKTFTVEVTNVVEQEQITVSPRFAEAGGASLTASLTAGDATTANLAEADWEWSGGAVDGDASDSPTATIAVPSTLGNHKD